MLAKLVNLEERNVAFPLVFQMDSLAPSTFALARSFLGLVKNQTI